MPDKRRNPKCDWPLLRAEYVEKNITLAELARAHDISYSTLSKRASKEGWSEKREEYGEIIAKKLSNRASNEQARYYARLLASADEISRRLEEAVKKDGQLYLHDAGENGEEQREMFNTAHAREMYELVRQGNEIFNEILGVLPRERIEEIELEKQRIAAETLAAENERRGADGFSAGGVIVLPGIKEMPHDD